jgi:hypothetical protein
VKQREAVAGKGIGEPLITMFLADVPGVNENTVRQHIAIRKASGDYAKIEEETAATIAAAPKEKRANGPWLVPENKKPGSLSQAKLRACVIVRLSNNQDPPRPRVNPKGAGRPKEDAKSKARSPKAVAREERIAARKDAGLKASQIAVEEGLTERAVRRFRRARASYWP